ncbi:2OG-Fe(II) oxygenase [Maricaulis maris]|uniref:Rps23 Pro-64 3,4-dihydroxylase Tpa1-like proline 4-hydroxylase n=1 Tax=Maricaulis maris TaxID=74318 RepID=A0A495DKT9_9PROT|nr:2OG-Fe(II) oxygenase family protein [Maricaulis maris]RKR03215.1 Rps23 Pro-64 3,4-dihydroxylase Tpa1-like proline 4-hydroxylase [Maricaulis maris]
MADTLDLRLNPALDAAEWASRYAEMPLVQIPDVFEPDLAEQISALLRETLNWRLVFPEPTPHGEDVIVQLTQQDVQRMGREAVAAQIGAVMQRAQKNYGYLYDAYPMIQAYTSHWDPGHPIHRVTEFLNSREFLDFGQAVTGAPLVTKADAQATRYARGHFLTRHVDEGHERERVAAYTLGFTRNWQTDWGGLLMLIEDGLDVSRAFLPRFNMLSIFDGRRMHAVSPVAPFAGEGRYQITGWFRNDPAAGAAG